MIKEQLVRVMLRSPRLVYYSTIFALVGSACLNAGIAFLALVYMLPDIEGPTWADEGFSTSPKVFCVLTSVIALVTVALVVNLIKTAHLRGTDRKSQLIARRDAVSEALEWIWISMTFLIFGMAIGMPDLGFEIDIVETIMSFSVLAVAPMIILMLIGLFRGPVRTAPDSPSDAGPAVPTSKTAN